MSVARSRLAAIVAAWMCAAGCGVRVRPADAGHDADTDVATGWDATMPRVMDGGEDARDAARLLAPWDGLRWQRPGTEQALGCVLAGYHTHNTLNVLWRQADASPLACSSLWLPNQPGCETFSERENFAQSGICVPDELARPQCLRAECLADEHCTARHGPRSVCVCVGAARFGLEPLGLIEQHPIEPLNYCTRAGECRDNSDCPNREECYPSVIASCAGNRIEGYFCSSPGDTCHGFEHCGESEETDPWLYRVQSILMLRSRSACRYQPSAAAFRCQAAVDCP
jgi:hypothetical protein